jgi:hypothetical protein
MTPREPHFVNISRGIRRFLVMLFKSPHLLVVTCTVRLPRFAFLASFSFGAGLGPDAGGAVPEVGFEFGAAFVEGDCVAEGADCGV